MAVVFAHSLMMSAQSCALSAKTTASGAWLPCQVSVLACCSRTACEVTSRLPKRLASASVTAVTVASFGLTKAQEGSGICVMFSKLSVE